jgi:ribosomal protein S18 acetylase RimI-like enzyme
MVTSRLRRPPAEISFRGFEDYDREAIRRFNQRALGLRKHKGSPTRIELSDIVANYTHNDGEFLLAFLNSELMAYGAFQRRSKAQAELEHMHIDPRAKTADLKSELLKRLELSAKAKGCTEMIVGVPSKQLLTQKFYETHGYEEYKINKSQPMATFFYRKDLKPFPWHDLGL